MILKLLLLPLGLLALPAFAQKPKLNVRLRQQLDSLDRAYRRHEQRNDAAFARAEADSLMKPIRLPSGALAGYTGPVQWERSPDSTDLRFVAAVIRRYGFPGKSLVGRPASMVAWQVLQRTSQTTRFLPQLRMAAEAGELPYQYYARAVDTQLMQAGKAQRYGTQFVNCVLINKATGQLDMVRFLWPVADVRRANELRRRAGFPTTIAQDAQLQGFPAESVTLEYALRMKQAAETGE
ncbi:hypothetical protein Q5H92_07355 [Hymenobacter sp. M29]|uniref:TonB C-terminal domain-containing protein n=1 Tax=Hymenobacter mellowenesis TaxID=3063995 RepID=A0ABT9A8J7_9BACT|nr:hypothetical protein [Hymenobacter sp. M29]MDO7846165.1 hypothetical protein [Hymenobacter sp. M29]